MRIIYFSRDYTTHDRRFLAELAKTGHTVYYLRLERRGHTLEERPLPVGIEPVAWAGGQQPFEPEHFPGLLADLQRVIADLQPDLIQAGPIQTCAYLTAQAGFHPLISTSWGSDLLLDSERTPELRQITQFTLDRSDALVGDCDPVRQKARSFGLANERIVTFPWGVDLQHFSPGPTGPSGQHQFRLLSTRSWEPVYGVDVLARAFVTACQRLARRGFDGLRLTMLGGGSQAPLLQEIFQTGGVLAQVEFPGQVNYAGLPACYTGCDLYIAASHSDGSSISLLEAMACGRPVLVSDIPGNREWVTPDVQGWLFPDGDSQAMADGIIAALDHRSRLPEMGRAARQLTEDRADWTKNFQKLLQAYEIGLSSVKAGPTAQPGLQP